MSANCDIVPVAQQKLWRSKRTIHSDFKTNISLIHTGFIEEEERCSNYLFLPLVCMNKQCITFCITDIHSYTTLNA
jgi:hypothetical protein